MFKKLYLSSLELRFMRYSDDIIGSFDFFYYSSPFITDLYYNLYDTFYILYILIIPISFRFSFSFSFLHFQFQYHFHYHILFWDNIIIKVKFDMYTVFGVHVLQCILHPFYIYINPISHHTISIYMPCIHNISSTHPLIVP